jgi:DNA-binding NarL/FixJ family response regulator
MPGGVWRVPARARRAEGGSVSDRRPGDDGEHGAGEPAGEPSPEGDALQTDPIDTLTPRELDILRSMTTGELNKSIARIVEIGEDTVKKHVSEILAKLGVPNRAAAAAAYERYLASRQREGDKREG